MMAPMIMISLSLSHEEAEALGLVVKHLSHERLGRIFRPRGFWVSTPAPSGRHEAAYRAVLKLAEAMAGSGSP